MSFITLGPKTQPDHIIHLTKKLVLNVTKCKELGFLTLGIVFDAIMAQLLIQGITKPFFPTANVTFATGMAFVAFCLLVSGLVKGRTTLVDMGFAKEDSGITINVVQDNAGTTQTVNHTNTQSA